MTSILKEVTRHSSSWPFRSPVDIHEVPDYMDVVTEPIDLTLIKGRLQSGYYKSKSMMLSDMLKMIDNCRIYNDKSTVFYKEADTLQVMVPIHIKLYVSFFFSCTYCKKILCHFVFCFKKNNLKKLKCF